MTEEQRYFFDLKGYLVLRNVLSAEHVAALNAMIDRVETRPDDLPPLVRFSERHGPDIYINNMKELGGPFEALIDPEPVIPLVREMIGTRIRLNHDYGIMRYHADGRTPFHLGNTPVRPSCQFRVHNGEFYSTLVKVVYPLTDQEVADGCFSTIPGSHKSNFPNPYGIEPEGIPVREPVPCRAGDAIIFTEAMTHGSEPKRTARPRRTLYFAYSPCWIADWAGGPEISAELLERVTERQRALLELQPMGTEE